MRSHQPFHLGGHTTRTHAHTHTEIRLCIQQTVLALHAKLTHSTGPVVERRSNKISSTKILLSRSCDKKDNNKQVDTRREGGRMRESGRIILYM